MRASLREGCPVIERRRLTHDSARLIDQVPDRGAFDQEALAGSGHAYAGVIVDESVACHPIQQALSF
jgi:hypothetical protein